MVGRRSAGRLVLALAGLTGLAALLSAPAPVRSADALTARIVSVENAFPDAVVFKVEAQSSAAPVTSVNLLVGIGPAKSEQSVALSFDRAPSVNGEVRFPARSVPAGATLRYTLQAEDAAGNRTTTEPQSLWYADIRYQWSELRDGPITVHYAGNSAADARKVLVGARDAQVNTGCLLGADVRPFGVLLYNSGRDAVGGQTRAQEGTGVRSRPFSDYALVQIVNEPRNGSIEDQSRHEVTHLFVAWAAPEAAPVPAWLNEGFAVWGQRDAGDLFRRALALAIERRDVPPLRTLVAFPAQLEANFFSYVQAWSVVSYLIDTFGPGKFRDAIQALSEGEEGALRRVYGLTLDTLDAAWRSQVGLPERSYDRVRPTPLPVFGGAEPATSAVAPPAADARTIEAPVTIGVVVTGVTALITLAAGAAWARRKRGPQSSKTEASL